jgi:hypothetical protein
VADRQPDVGSPSIDAGPSRAVAAIERTLAVLGPIGVTMAVLWLARGTLLPGVAFWDTAEFQAVPPLLGTLHPTGFPTYTIAGWLLSVALAPLGSPAFLMNLFSALCVAAAAGLTVVLVRQLTGRPVIAIAAGAILFVTGITWAISTHADAHSLHLALLALVLVLLVGWESRVRVAIGPPSPAEPRSPAGSSAAADVAPAVGPAPAADRWLVAAAVAYAFAVANHSLAVLAGPGIAAFVLLVQPGILHRRVALTSVAAFAVVAGLLYLELPLRAGPFRAPLVYGHPDTLTGFLYIVSGAQFSGTLGLSLGDLGTRFHAFVDLTADQLGPLAALLPIAGVLAAVRRPRYLVLTGPTLAITCLFAVTYSNADIDRYYLGPLLIALTWLAIIVAWICDAVAGAIGRSGRSVAAIGLVLDVALAAVLVAPAVASADAVRRSVDLSASTAAADWLDRVLGELRPDAVVVSWWSYSTPLWYGTEVEGRRRDITIIDDRNRLDDNLGDVPTVIDSYLGRRPVYVIRVPQDLAALEARYVLEPVPDGAASGLALVVGRRPEAAP